MPARSLREFLQMLDDAGELLRVPGLISPRLEISAVADLHARRHAGRLSAAAMQTDPDHARLGGKALLFENVAGCDFPVAINVFGSYARMEMALRCHERGGFAHWARRIEVLAQPAPPSSLGAALQMAGDLLPLLRVGPRRGGNGPCQECVQLTERGEVDLTRLPLIQCWPLDGDTAAVSFGPISSAGTAAGQGRYITFAGMHTIHADDADAARPPSHNIGMYRAQLVDRTHLAMHWHLHHDGAAHWRSWKAAGKPMPIAICLGGEPVLPYAATAPLPPGLSELLMAGFLNGGGIRMVRAHTVPLWVPASCDIVIEGYVDTECGGPGWTPGSGEPLGPGAVLEGPFGDHTGYYSLPDRYPLVSVTAVTHRRDAIFPATIVGLPPQEDYYLGKATERIFLPLLRTLIPDLLDYHLPRFGCFHNCAFLQIDKCYALQGRRIMHAVWGAGQMAWTKTIVVVDADVAVHDERAVLEAIFTNCDFRRDVELVNGPLDILDHAAPRLGAGHKIGFDATTKMPGDEVNGIPIEPLSRDGLRHRPDDSRIAELATPGFGHGRCVFVAVRKLTPGDGAAAIESIWETSDTGADLVIAVDDRVDVDDPEQVLFHWCANTDPGRDLLRQGHRIGFDATRKIPGDERHGDPVRPYPPIIQMDEAVTRQVLARATELGLDSIGHDTAR